MQLDISGPVNAFRQAIVAAWPFIQPLTVADQTGSMLDDWLQANWECLVEGSIDPALGIVLEPYGNGADCNGGSSRVWRPELLPNAAVYVRHCNKASLVDVIDGDLVHGGAQFSHFGALAGGWPAIDAPFDLAVLETEKMTAIAVDSLRYFVEPQTGRNG